MVVRYIHSQSSVGVPVKAEPLSPISPFITTLPSPAGRPRVCYDFSASGLPVRTLIKNDGERSHSDFISLSKYHNIPYHDSFPHLHDIGTIRTPSLTPGPSEDDPQSRRSSMSLGHYDPILDSLNMFRAKGKCPLQPVDTLVHQSPPSPVGHSWEPLPIVEDKPKYELLAAQETKQQPEKRQKGGHCNIKYTTEELDYIRYHRVDLGESWKQIEEHFTRMFPMDKFPDGRVTGGLQGVYYRQHKVLPVIINGQLQFMENGHVLCDWKKMRQREPHDKHLYSLLHLYPDRAMKYPWIPRDYRQRALELNQERQPQMETARLETKKRGTYVKKLPPDIPCGCCPGEDRERNPVRHVYNRKPTLRLPIRRRPNARGRASKL
ncbi:hypothetical protein F5Y08DRAFT_47307 [Xylaria arbuscula]|nr:hypothetical protein F5Y08DRAFT_47307 [Xylaria arbuscula]